MLRTIIFSILTVVFLATGCETGGGKGRDVESYERLCVDDRPGPLPHTAECVTDDDCKWLGEDWYCVDNM